MHTVRLALRFSCHSIALKSASTAAAWRLAIVCIRSPRVLPVTIVVTIQRSMKLLQRSVTWPVSALDRLLLGSVVLAAMLVGL
jgi:hypothetical protein